MTRNVLIPAIAVTLLSACAGTVESPFETARYKQPIVLNVENNNWSDAIVHIVYLGSRRRLSQVGGMSAREIVIPRARVPATRTIQILVTFVGSSERFVTSDLRVDPGDQIYLRLERDLHISSWSVR